MHTFCLPRTGLGLQAGDLLLVGLRIGHSRAGFGDGFEEIERIAALHRVVYVLRHSATAPAPNAC